MEGNPLHRQLRQRYYKNAIYEDGIVLILNAKTAIAESLETAFRLKTYMAIMDEVREEPFIVSENFRKRYNGYYRLRQQKQTWYDHYYRLMEEQCRNQRSFEELLIEMYDVGGKVDVSFVSKLIASVNPDKPIWDKYVLVNLGFSQQWQRMQNKSSLERIKAASKIYEEIELWYADFITSKEGMACVEAFDSVLSNYKNKLSNVKKIDYLLWSKH